MNKLYNKILFKEPTFPSFLFAFLIGGSCVVLSVFISIVNGKPFFVFDAVVGVILGFGLCRGVLLVDKLVDKNNSQNKKETKEFSSLWKVVMLLIAFSSQFFKERVMLTVIFVLGIYLLCFSLVFWKVLKKI